MGLRVLVSPDLGTLIPPYSYPSLLGTPLLHSSVLLLLVPPGLRILRTQFLPPLLAPPHSYSSYLRGLRILIPPGLCILILQTSVSSSSILLLFTPQYSLFPSSQVSKLYAPLRMKFWVPSFLPPPQKKRMGCGVARGKKNDGRTSLDRLKCS